MLYEEGYLDLVIISQSNPIAMSTFEIDHYQNQAVILPRWAVYGECALASGSEEFWVFFPLSELYMPITTTLSDGHRRTLCALGPLHPDLHYSVDYIDVLCMINWIHAWLYWDFVYVDWPRWIYRLHDWIYWIYVYVDQSVIAFRFVFLDLTIFRSRLVFNKCLSTQ
jgi:hypothetical protein